MRGSARYLLLVPVVWWGATEANAASCAAERGAVNANTLVGQCLEVSPATHPPCNIQNSCAMIENEISRSCKMLDDDKPDFCDTYE